MKKALFKKKTLEKKSQQEIAGFVIIVVLVSVIGLVLFSLTIGRGETKINNNAEISHLLDASMYYTTDCAINFMPQYENMEELIKSCFNKERCLNEKDSCEVLKENFEKITERSLVINQDSPNKAYKLNIYYRVLNSTIPDLEILKTEKGEFKNCSSKTGSSRSISSGEGNIEIELEVCRG
jgi:hypothetical protein